MLGISTFRGTLGTLIADDGSGSVESDALPWSASTVRWRSFVNAGVGEKFLYRLCANSSPAKSLNDPQLSSVKKAIDCSFI
jgi:hypothetical protein